MHGYLTFCRLLGSFLKVGAFTFGGGYAMLPLIEREVIDRRKWVKREDFLELLTLAQTAPGPISLNAAVFVGYRVGGYAGAVAALAGVVLPSFVIILLIAIYFSDLRDNYYVNAAFTGMRPAVVALIVASVFNLARGLRWWKTVLAGAVAVTVWLLGMPPAYIIAAGALAGVIYAFCNRKATNSMYDRNAAAGSSTKPDYVKNGAKSGIKKKGVAK